MMIIVFFLAELLVLFFLSRRLTSRLLALLGPTWYGILFLPGILLHELSHFLVATLLFVRTGKIEILPRHAQRGDEDKRVQLGSIGIAQTDPIRRFLIGIAPIVVGTSVMLWVLFVLAPGQVDLVRYALLTVIVFEIGNTMFSSRKDLEGALELFIVATIVLAVLFLLNVRLPSGAIERVFSDETESMMRTMTAFFLIPIALDTILLVLQSLHGRGEVS